MGLVEEIRMLPMSEKDDEFTGKDIAFVQEWFLKTLPLKIYYAKRNMMNAKNGTLVLFRYKSKVIACANLEYTIKCIKSNPGYTVGYYFDTYSIKTFVPLDKNEIQNIWPKVKSYGQAVIRLDATKYDKFMSLIENHGFESIK